MNLLPVIVVLLTAAPVCAQARVYTNADLSPHPVTWSRSVTAAELAGLQDRAFRLPAALPLEPTVIIVSERIEPQPLPPTRPLSAPWRMTAYVGRSPWRSSVPVVTIGQPASGRRHRRVAERCC
jgi:hypothetical protein